MRATAKNTLLVFIASISTAFAANGVENADHSILMYIFLGFGALIVVCQAVPGCMLFFSMLKGLRAPKETLLAKKSDKTA